MEGGQNLKVSKADQDMINRYARGYAKMQEIKKEVGAYTNEIENCEEAENEVMLLDDEDSKAIPMKIGEAFIHMDSEEVDEQLKDATTQAKLNLSIKQKALDKLVVELEGLKKTLYSKFGEAINLDE
uniref:Prefoldin subunit 4 n=1 Tax=Rhabditophanes sp. KR3021 TaxID=114890 RepID=A0AC35TRE0_9BILA